MTFTLHSVALKQHVGFMWESQRRTWAGKSLLKPPRLQGATVRPAYLHQKSVPLVLALNGLDGDILSFPHGLEDNSKRSSTNHLNKVKAAKIIRQ